MAAILDRYIAAMVLSGVGDAMGYKNGNWEFCHSGVDIHREAAELGGIEKLKIKLPHWMVSDDTVLHLATAEAYMAIKDVKDKEKLYKKIAEKYKEAMKDMGGRAPGPTTMGSVHKLKPWANKGYQIPFDSRGGGCGAAMRAMCIGLRYPRPEDLSDLIADSIESGRMTHHHPTGFLGSMTASLFTSYAVQNKPTEEWGVGLIENLQKAREYIEKNGHEVEENLKSWDYFENAWKNYLKLRQIESGKKRPVFPEKYDIEERDKFYKSVSFSGWGGASGHDAPMIAYDAMLGAQDNWIELCKRGILHSGDNDSTGVMAGCWFGARHGFKGVPKNHYKKLEYRDRLEKAGKAIYEQSLVELNHSASSVDHESKGSQLLQRDSSHGSQSCTDSNQNSGSYTYSNQENMLTKDHEEQISEPEISEKETLEKINDQEKSTDNPELGTPESHNKDEK